MNWKRGVERVFVLLWIVWGIGLGAYLGREGMNWFTGRAVPAFDMTTVWPLESDGIMMFDNTMMSDSTMASDSMGDAPQPRLRPGMKIRPGMTIRDLVQDPTFGYPDSMLSPRSQNYLNRPLPADLSPSLSYKSKEILLTRLRGLELRSGMKARDLLGSAASSYPDGVLDYDAVEVLNTPLPEGVTAERARAISAALLSWLPGRTLDAKAAATHEVWRYALTRLGLWLGLGGIAPLAVFVALRWVWAGFERTA